MIERAMEVEETPAEAEETATLSLSMLGGQKVAQGDVVRLKVISVDEENGTYDAAYDHPKQEDGIGAMARKFDEPEEGDELA